MFTGFLSLSYFKLFKNYIYFFGNHFEVCFLLYFLQTIKSIFLKKKLFIKGCRATNLKDLKKAIYFIYF